jgi:tetratricopeptide (TPR) repeat protein
VSSQAIRPWRLVRIAFLVFAVLATSAIGFSQWVRLSAERSRTEAQAAIDRFDLHSAASHFDHYRALKPDDSAGWLDSARIERRLGHIALAKQYLAEYENRNGDREAIRFERELLLVQQGLFADIDTRLRMSVDPDHPNVTLVLEALARGYLAVERWPDARQACELWRAVQPEAYWPWLWGGSVSERMGQIEEASEFYRRAFDLHPDDREVRLALARIRVRMRNSPAAVEHY